ncbi:MAG: hypothetical protein ACI4QV_02565, partial [Acutalibacteraceae bacterium]
MLNRETERVLKDIGSADGITVESSNALMYKIVFSVISKLHTDFASEIKKKLSQYKERLSIADLELCEAFTVAAYSELCREAFIKDDPYLIEKGVKGIRHIGLINFDELADEYSAVEEIFRKDPAGAYPKMSKESRAYYRKQCGELARIKKCSEKEVALHALNEALKAENPRERHIGYYIIEKNEKRKGRKVRAKVYIILRTVLPLAIGVTTGLILKRPFLFIPLYLPLFEIIRPVIEDLIMRKVDPFLIPKYDKNTEEVKNAKTVIVVSSL